MNRRERREPQEAEIVAQRRARNVARRERRKLDREIREMIAIDGRRRQRDVNRERCRAN